MGKKSRLKKDRAEMAKAEGPSSAAAAATDANSSSIRTMVLPIDPSFASVLGPPFSSSASSSSSSSSPASQSAAAPDRPPDFYIGVDARGDPRLILRGSEAYEVTHEPANREASPDLYTERDDREASPDRCTRPCNASPPPSPPSTSMPSGSGAGTSTSSVSKGSKKKAGGCGSSGDGSSSSKKESDSP